MWVLIVVYNLTMYVLYCILYSFKKPRNLRSTITLTIHIYLISLTSIIILINNSFKRNLLYVLESVYLVYHSKFIVKIKYYCSCLMKLQCYYYLIKKFIVIDRKINICWKIFLRRQKNTSKNNFPFIEEKKRKRGENCVLLEVYLDIMPSA